MDIDTLRALLHESFMNLNDNLFFEAATRRIEEALVRLASDERVHRGNEEVLSSLDALRKAREADGSQEHEVAMLNLYLRLHSLGGGYTDDERSRLERKFGNRNIPGGIAPLVLAGNFITQSTVSVDLGAGNGLQGLLMQYLWPHRKTLQVELSSGLILAGREFQRSLGVPDDRVEWMQRDIVDVPIQGVDLVYLYRPARPYAEGNALYRAIAIMLSEAQKPLVVISVADCLERFLDRGFSALYRNEHISVFVNKAFLVQGEIPREFPLP